MFKKILKNLQRIDWRRSAPEWKLRVIRADGRIMTSNKAIVLAANIIKKHLEIPLNQEEKEKEEKFINSVNI